jgi:hypothetical protein
LAQADRTTFFANEGTLTIKAFGGVGRRYQSITETIAEVDTIVFSGSALIAENLQLTQVGSDLELSFPV